METNQTQAPSSPQAPSPAAAPQAAPEAAESSAKPTDDPGEWATRFANLSKQSRKLLGEQQRLKQERDQHANDLAEYQKYKQAKDQAKVNPSALLESFGLTYQELTDYYLNDAKPDTEKKLLQLEKRLEDDLKAREEEKQSAQAEQAEKVISGFKQEIESHVRQKGDQYELIDVTPGGHDLVLQVIEEFWNEHNSIPDLDEACKYVEDYLTEQAKPFLSLKKFAPKSEPQDDKAARQQDQAGNFTLTNQGTAAPATTQRPYLSDEESKRAAASLIRWN